MTVERASVTRRLEVLLLINWTLNFDFALRLLLETVNQQMMTCDTLTIHQTHVPLDEL